MTTSTHTRKSSWNISLVDVAGTHPLVCTDTFSLVQHKFCAKFVPVFDDTMSFEEHVIELCRTAFFHIRNVSRINPCLSINSTKTLVHALVMYRLDYCNALLYGLPDYLIQR